MTSFQGLYNEYTGTFDSIIIDTANINTATIGTATVTTANITTENVGTSIINNLTIGNVLYFPDGTQLFPSIAFANEIRTGIYRYGTNQIGLVTNGILRALITNSGLISVFNVQAGGQFLCNSSSVSSPSYSFVGDPTTGLYESGVGEVSIAGSGSQVISFNNSLITALVNLLVPNITISGQLKNSVLYLDSSKNLRSIQLTNGQLLIGSNGTIPTAATLTGTTNQINVTNGAGSITLSTPQNIDPTATPTFASETLTNTTNQLVLGTTNTTTLNVTAPAASRTYTIPDSGANSSFVLTDGTQTINGNKTFSSRIAITPTLNQIVLGTTNTTTISANPPGASRTYSIPDVFTTAATEFVMSTGIQTISGVKTFSSSVFLTGLVANGMLSLTSTGLVNSNLLANGQIFIGRTGNTPINTTLTGTANQIIVTNGSGSITLSTPQNIATTSSPTFAGLTINGNINVGTNSMTCGALSTTSINNSGTSTLIGAVSCGAITSTGDFTNTTNNITCGSITANPSGTNPFAITSNVGSTTNGFQSLAVNVTSPIATNFYGIGVSKFSTDAIMMGVNKNTTTGDLPTSCTYLSSYNTNSSLSIGRGNGTGLPNKSDILIDGNGAITTTNNILVIRTCTSSASINTTAPTTFTTWDTSIVNQGNTTYSTGVWTIQTTGVYQCSYDVCWAASASGYRQAYINATAGAFACSIINSPGSIVLPHSGSAPIKCAIGDSINLLVYQSSGSAINIQPSGDFQVRFSIVKIQ